MEDLARSDAIGVELIDGKLRARPTKAVLKSDPSHPVAHESLAVEDHINMWLQMQVVLSGPKVFRPTLEHCLAMEQVAPRIAIGDYVQPYPVMVIDLPEEYRHRRVCAFGSIGGVSAHVPVCLLIGAYGQPPWTIWLSVVLDSGRGLQHVLLPTSQTIEDGIVSEFGHDSYVPADMPADCYGTNERAMVASLLRLAVNAMLLLSDLGCEHLGPSNPSHYHRLERYAQVARKRRTGIVEADRNLRLAPQLYGFPQNIVLHAEERTSTESLAGNGHPDVPRRPHWRRGHWKMQACGPSRSQHKRLFIKPVLVNRHLLRDGEGIPQTTYRVQSEAPAAQTNSAPFDRQEP